MTGQGHDQMEAHHQHWVSLLVVEHDPERASNIVAHPGKPRPGKQHPVRQGGGGVLMCCNIESEPRLLERQHGERAQI